MDGLTKRARRTRARAAYWRIVSARTRSQAYARSHTRTHLHTQTWHRCIYTYILCMTCALAAYPGGRTHACARDGDGRIVGARNRTHVCMGGGAAACTPMPTSHTSTHIPTSICIMPAYRYRYIYIYIYTYEHIHTYIPSFVRAALATHVGIRACAFPHVCICAHTHARAHRRRRRAQRPAPHRRPAERVPPAVARRPGRKGRRIPRTSR